MAGQSYHFLSLQMSTLLLFIIYHMTHIYHLLQNTTVIIMQSLKDLTQTASMKKPSSLKNKNEVLISKILVFAKLGISFWHTESWEKHFVHDLLLVSNSLNLTRRGFPKNATCRFTFQCNAACIFTFQCLWNPDIIFNIINATSILL